MPDDSPSHRAFFRRKFTIPSAWKDGDFELWMQNWTKDPVRGKLDVLPVAPLLAQAIRRLREHGPLSDLLVD